MSAMSDSLLQSFDSTSSCSYSQSFFSSPVPGVVSSSLSPLDSISPRPQAASSVSMLPVHQEVPVVPVSAFPLVRAPSSAPMVEIHIEFVFDVPEISPSHSIYCECLKCWPIGPVRVAVPEVPPSSPSTCEVNVARPPKRCMSCVPDLYVCPAHLIACGAMCFICCNFCLQVLCLKHMYCPCAAAVARRAWVPSNFMSSQSGRAAPSMSSHSGRASPAVSASLSGASPVLLSVPSAVPAVGSPVSGAFASVGFPVVRSFGFSVHSNNLNDSHHDCP